MPFPDTQFAGLGLIDYVNGATPQEFFKESDATQWDNEIIALTAGLRSGQFRLVFNDTGVLILKGKPVKLGAFNVPNSAPVVTLAQADAEANFSDGVALADIAIGSTGIIVKRHVVTGLDTSAFTVLDDIFLDAAAPGVLVNVAPANEQRLGRVTVDDAATGQIEFDVERGAGGNSPADDVTLEDTGAILRVKALGIGTAQLAGSAVTIQKLSPTVRDLRQAKQNDQTKNADAVLAADDDLLLTLLAGQHLFRAILFIEQAAGVAGIKLKINFNAAIVASRFLVTDQGKDNQTFNSDASNKADETLNMEFFFSQGAAGVYIVIVEGWFETSAGGNLSVQWAQKVSNANDTKLLAGSQWTVRLL